VDEDCGVTLRELFLPLLLHFTIDTERRDRSGLKATLADAFATAFANTEFAPIKSLKCFPDLVDEPTFPVTNP
jgi:hypothetical protein